MFAHLFNRKKKKKPAFSGSRRHRMVPSFELLEGRDAPALQVAAGVAHTSIMTPLLANTTVVDFNDLALAPNSYWNGSDGSGGFTSRGTSFNNSYDPTYGDWSGWSYTDINYTNTALYPNYPNDPDYYYEYGAYPGTASQGSGNCGVAYCGGAAPTITIPNGMQVQSAMFTNTTYAALSMLNGDPFAKQFGPTDWFLLTITGENASGNVVGTVPFYLAQKGSVVTTWQTANLSSLATATTLVFSETSSDTGMFGMNTPAYFAMDNLTLVPKSTATTTTVSASPASVVYGNPITLTATVTASAGIAAPTGSIDFTDTTTGKNLGTSNLNVGAGTSSTAALTVAATGANLFTVSPADKIAATYEPSAGFVGSSGSTTVDISGAYAINLVGGNAVTAGASFILTVQACDAFGNPLTSYSGPATVTLSASPTDPQGNFPMSVSLNSSGFGFALGTLKTAGNYTLSATATNFSGHSSSITVAPAGALYFTVAAPSTAVTGSPVNVTVTARDPYGNVATAYVGTIKLSSSDSAANLGGNYSFTTGSGQDNGVHTFSVILDTAGNETVSITDATATQPYVTGTSNAVAVRGLIVQSFVPTPTGFIVTFNKPIVPGDITLYGSTTSTVNDVVVSGAGVGAIHGSLFIDPTNQIVTFKATASYLQLLNRLHGGNNSVVLPDATYTVTLVSGAGGNGFLDQLGAGLDGANTGGHASFTTSFTTHYQANHTSVLGLPDFARGPDRGTPIAVPNNGAAGIPVTLYNAAGVTDVTFTFSYNGSLLDILGTVSGASSDATDPNATLTLVSNTGGVATFHYTDVAPQSATPATPLVLGDIKAIVPSTPGSAALGLYKTAELLQLGVTSINNGAVTGAVVANAVHLNAYFGDVNGDGVVDGLDKLAANTVAIGRGTGFSTFAQLDPVIVGDVAGDESVDAGDVSTIDAYVAQLAPTQIPVPPTQLAPGNPNYLSPSSLIPSASQVIAQVPSADRQAATSAEVSDNVTPQTASKSAAAAIVTKSVPAVIVAANPPAAASPGILPSNTTIYVGKPFGLDLLNAWNSNADAEPDSYPVAWDTVSQGDISQAAWADGMMAYLMSDGTGKD